MKIWQASAVALKNKCGVLCWILCYVAEALEAICLNAHYKQSDMSSRTFCDSNNPHGCIISCGTPGVRGGGTISHSESETTVC